MWKALQKQLVIAGDAPGKTCTFRCDHVLPGGLGGTVTVLMGTVSRHPIFLCSSLSLSGALNIVLSCLFFLA